MQPELRILLLSVLITPITWANRIYETNPINYYDAAPVDAVSEYFSHPGNLKDWYYDPSLGYLKSFLKAFNIPSSSQTLVFSKTSLQARRINSKNPRALYFSEDIHVGWVPSGDFLEVAVSSPTTGMNFYTVERGDTQPQLVQKTHECLRCHAGSMTREIPGLMVRSLYPLNSGQPIFKAGSQIINQTIPLKKRWGGWFVTGISVKHLGNRVYKETTEGVDGGTPLHPGTFNNKYLNNSSDVIALLVLEHQAQLHTLLSALTIHTRRALYEQQVLDEYLERTKPVSDSSRTRIKHHADNVLKYMFFVDETRIPEIDVSQSIFAQDFSSLTPHDKKNRTLYQLQMKRRMFRYPFSYMVYSDTFNQLPSEALNYLWPEIARILNPQFIHPGYEHLNREDKIAIKEILLETHPAATTYWH